MLSKSTATAAVNAMTGKPINQIGAETGRLSMSDPNLQNIPIRTDEGRRIRLAFVPGDAQKNVLLTADYSQIELRFLTHFTHEPALVRSFTEDEDVHRIVASEVFGVPLFILDGAAHCSSLRPHQWRRR